LHFLAAFFAGDCGLRFFARSKYANFRLCTFFRGSVIVRLTADQEPDASSVCPRAGSVRLTRQASMNESPLLCVMDRGGASACPRVAGDLGSGSRRLERAGVPISISWRAVKPRTIRIFAHRFCGGASQIRVATGPGSKPAWNPLRARPTKSRLTGPGPATHKTGQGKASSRPPRHPSPVQHVEAQHRDFHSSLTFSR
jgi:hypothetical protein